MMSERVARMASGDVLDYVTPGRLYTIRLIAHPNGVAHVEIMRGAVTIRHGVPRPIAAAAAEAREFSQLYKKIDTEV